MPTFHQLSATGSDRATGYNMSNKIIRRDCQLFVGWLDAPSNLGAPARIQLGVCDQQGKLQRFMQSLSIGSDGSVHLLFQFHYAESGQVIDCKGYAIVHLQLDDGGESWFYASMPGKSGGVLWHRSDGGRHNHDPAELTATGRPLSSISAENLYRTYIHRRLSRQLLCRIAAKHYVCFIVV